MLSIFYLVGLLAAATYTDHRYHRIPNALTLGGLLAGYVCAASITGNDIDLMAALLGSALGLCLFLPFYMIGKMGAGDVKLLAMSGAFLGPQGVLWAAAFTAIAGGVLALAWLVFALGLRGLMYTTLGSFTSLSLRCDDGDEPQAEDDSPFKAKMPYALAIAVGSIAAAARVSS